MPNRFSFSAWLFLRVLAVIYAIALVSFAVQWSGLIGPHGRALQQRFERFDIVRNGRLP